MPHLALYDVPTGLIRGVWSAASTDLLGANIRTDDPTVGYLLFEEPPDPAVAQALYKVENGQLVLQEEART